MERVFLQVLNMSLTGSYVIIAVILLRQLLRKAPKRISYALWAVALFRLVCPFSLESSVSLLPSAKPLPETVLLSHSPQVQSGIRVIDQAVQLPAPAPGDSANPMQIWMWILGIVWVVGIVLLLGYSLISWLLLRRRIQGAALLGDGVYCSDTVPEPFVLGMFRPKIYLPAGLSEQETQYIVSHERFHIQRHDPFFKMLGFFTLCLHWFNPLVWIAFLLMTKDMEMSCDERVIESLGTGVKQEYSRTLLAFASASGMPKGAPLAFGESNVKSRIRNVLSYKKPVFWVTVVLMVLLAAVGVGFSVNPQSYRPLGRVAPELPSISPEVVSKVVVESPARTAAFVEKDRIEEIYQMISRLPVSSNAASQSRGDGDSVTQVTFYDKDVPEQIRFQLHINDDMTRVWVDNMIEPSYPYEVEDPAALLRQLDSLLGPAEPSQWIEGQPGGGEDSYQAAVAEASGYAEENPFLKELDDSMAVVDHNVIISIPNRQLPEGQSFTLTLTYTRGGEEYPLFGSRTEQNAWEPGTTYQQILPGGEILEGSKVNCRVELLNAEGRLLGSSSHTTYLPEGEQHRAAVEIPSERGEAHLRFINIFGDSFGVTMSLPEGFTFRRVSDDDLESPYPYSQLALFNGEQQIGSFFYESYDTYEDIPPQEYYKAVYSSIMIGSMMSWREDYAEVRRFEDGAAATCTVWEVKPLPGQNTAESQRVEGKGVLCYNDKLHIFIALSMDDNSLTDDQLLALAQSVTLEPESWQPAGAQ